MQIGLLENARMANHTFATSVAFMNALMKHRGWKATRLAKEAGLVPSTVTRPLRQWRLGEDPTSMPNVSTLVELGKGAGLTVNQTYYLLSRIEADPSITVASALSDAPINGTKPQLVPADKNVIGAASESETEAELVSSLRATMSDIVPRNLPVMRTIYGPADNGEIFMLMLKEPPVEHVRRPTAVALVKDAFVARMIGTTMEPRYFDGEYLPINPARSAAEGDHVLVEMVVKPEWGIEEGGRVFKVGRLIRRSAHEVVIIQYNPEKENRRELTYSADQFVSVLRVMTPEEYYAT